MNRNNITKTDSMIERVRETMQCLSDSVSMTLGPYAKTTIVEDRMKNHSITKDGYTVLRSIFFENDLSRTIFEIVLKISKTLVRKVGDGSTSSIVIANNLYNNIIPMINRNQITSKDLLDIMNDISVILEENILKEAKPISEDMHELSYIASVSCNNDNNFGELIKEIFTKIGRYGFINLEKSLTEKTYYELKNGFEIPRGYISTLMANQPDNVSVQLEEPLVLMIDGIIEEKDLEPLSQLLGYVVQNGKSFVIVSSGYSNEATTFFHANRLNAKRKQNDAFFSVVAIDIATKDSDSKNKFDDLAINLGCSPIRKTLGDSLSNYDQELLLKACGSCKRFKGNEFNSKFIDGNGNKEEKANRVNEILKELEKTSKNETTVLYDTKIYELRKRMALLQNSMATLYIGGASEQEKDTDKYLLEDAVSACKSALKYGYVLGGNLIIPIIINHNHDDIVSKLEDKYSYIKNTKTVISDIVDIIDNSFKDSFRKVLENYYGTNSMETLKEVESIINTCIETNNMYNLKLHVYEDKNDIRIINSCQTDIEIMKAAISIIGLVATSNQFIGLNLNE